MKILEVPGGDAMYSNFIMGPSINHTYDYLRDSSHAYGGEKLREMLYKYDFEMDAVNLNIERELLEEGVFEVS